MLSSQAFRLGGVCFFRVFFFFFDTRRWGRSKLKHLVTCFWEAILGRSGALGKGRKDCFKEFEAVFGVLSDYLGPGPTSSPLCN